MDNELPLWSQTPSAKVRPPGEDIREELEKRGWGQAELAKIVGRPLPTINEIIQGKRAIMPEMAVALGTAFGTGAMYWMQKESTYRLSLVEQHDPETGRRARLFDMAPVKEMERRSWIIPSPTVDGLEKELCRFFGVESLDDEPTIHAAARQTFKAQDFTAAQRAWAFRAARLASLLNVRPFSPESLAAGLPEIRALAQHAEKIRHVPRVLAEIGIRLVIVEPLPKTRIDGAAFWLDEKPDAPVVVLSLRHDRIDWFWHTLAHELFHIKNGDKRSIDINLVGETRIETLDEMETRADREGAAFLLSPEKLNSFVIRVRPFFSKEKIIQFAQRMQIHPGIVNGQLQHLGHVGWQVNREMLVKVRDLLTASAITDGWGKPITD